MKLIIQIPCYNEEGTLEVALNDLPRRIDGIDEIEYLIVDDGSSDGTVKVAERWGVQHIVRFKENRGLARGFMAGLDEAIRRGADIIVNTDADDQYFGGDIETLIRPILDGKADMVIGERPIGEMGDFSPLKKKLQRFGSFVVRKASHTDIPDAPSGFRAFSRDAAMRLYVVNDYTYTLETIVQAGREKIALASVPVRTNRQLRPSRLSSGMWGYVKKSMLTILRAYMMYKPLMCFTLLALPSLGAGIAIGLRFLWFYARGGGGGHIQSLLLSCTLVIIGCLTFTIGLLADVISANRKLISDMRYRFRRWEDEFTRGGPGQEGAVHLDQKSGLYQEQPGDSDTT